MKHRNIILLFVCIVVAHDLAGQTNSGKGIDSTYIEVMDRSLNIKVNLNNDVEGFAANTNTGDYHFQPNSKYVLKLSANYGIFAVSFSSTPGFLPGNNDDDTKGTSKNFSFRTSLNFNHWVQNLEYTQTKGYYESNSNPYVIVPKLEYHGFKGQTGYKLNPRFSFKALNVQSERQLKSAGSLMPVLTYNYYTIDNKVELTGSNSSQRTNNFELTLSAGYYYTFVLHHSLYLSAGAALGTGFINTKLLTRLPSGTITDKNSEPLSRFDWGGEMGYNGERFFAGVQFTGYWSFYNQDEVVTYINDRSILNLFAGYRFNPPEKLKRANKKIKEKEAELLKGREQQQ